MLQPRQNPQPQQIWTLRYSHLMCSYFCSLFQRHCEVVLPSVAQRSMRRQWKNCLGGWFFFLLPFQQNNLQLWMFNTGHVCPLTHWRKHRASKFVLNTWHWSPKSLFPYCVHINHMFTCQNHPLSDPCTQGRLRALVRCPRPPKSSSADTKTGGKHVCVIQSPECEWSTESPESHHRMLEDPVTAWFFVSNWHFTHSN